MHALPRHTLDRQTRLHADLDGFVGRAFAHSLAASDSMAGVRTCGTTTIDSSRDFGGKQICTTSEGDSNTGRRVKSD